MTTTDLREKIARTLEGHGLSAHPDQYDSNIHGWRCEYPDRYGPCSCFEDLVAAVLPIVADEVRKAKEEAWDVGVNNWKMLGGDPDYPLYNPYRKETDDAK